MPTPEEIQAAADDYYARLCAKFEAIGYQVPGVMDAVTEAQDIFAEAADLLGFTVSQQRSGGTKGPPPAR